jgi:hypothetical protein
MNLTGTEVRLGMVATANTNSVNSLGAVQIGTPILTVGYQDSPTVAYSLKMDIADGESLTLDLSSGEVTTTSDPYNPVMIVTGTLTDGTDPVTFPVLPYMDIYNGKGEYYADGGDYSINWQGSQFPEGWALYKSVYGVISVWTSTADVATPDLVPSGAWNATTNPDAWKPVSPATGTPVVTASVVGASAYRLSGAEWDMTDYEGQPLPAMTKVHSTLVKCLSSDATVSISVDTQDPATTECPFYTLEVSPSGEHRYSAESVTFAATGDISLTIDIHAG